MSPFGGVLPLHWIHDMIFAPEGDIIHGRAAAVGWIPSTGATPDGDVDPPLLPRPTMSTMVDGDPSPTVRVPPPPFLGL
jgi:hypothetical protein